MRKPLTGEPCAGEPHARFGGRGGRESFSTPITEQNALPPRQLLDCAHVFLVVNGLSAQGIVVWEDAGE